jgi:hypothetical protein
MFRTPLFSYYKDAFAGLFGIKKMLITDDADREAGCACREERAAQMALIGCRLLLSSIRTKSVKLQGK